MCCRPEQKGCRPEQKGCHPEQTGCHPEQTGCHPEQTGCHPEPVEGRPLNGTATIFTSQSSINLRCLYTLLTAIHKLHML